MRKFALSAIVAAGLLIPLAAGTPASAQQSHNTCRLTGYSDKAIGDFVDCRLAFAGWCDSVGGSLSKADSLSRPQTCTIER